MKIAIMQPYFYPYAGYFRLFSQTDLMVIYDCVQFPRRGYVHRCKYFPASQNTSENLVPRWLTLPLKKQARSIKIKDIEFSEQANQQWHARFLNHVSRLEVIDDTWRVSLLNLENNSPIDYLINHLKTACSLLEIQFRVIRSSTMNLPESLKGKDRIIEICKKLDAHEYLNSPGGLDLYHQQDFNRSNIKLEFLKPFQGDMNSLLFRLMNESIIDIRKEIVG